MNYAALIRQAAILACAITVLDGCIPIPAKKPEPLDPLRFGPPEAVCKHVTTATNSPPGKYEDYAYVLFSGYGFKVIKRGEDAGGEVVYDIEARDLIDRSKTLALALEPDTYFFEGISFRTSRTEFGRTVEYKSQSGRSLRKTLEAGKTYFIKGKGDGENNRGVPLITWHIDVEVSEEPNYAWYRYQNYEDAGFCDDL